MTTIGERRRNKRFPHLQRQHQQTQQSNEPELKLNNIDTTPSVQFHAEQQQQQDDESIKVQKLLATLLLDDKEINGNARKIFHNYCGENLAVSVLCDQMEKTATDHYTRLLLEKYPNKTDLKSIGNLTLKVIFYAIQPETLQEAGYIINELRNGFKLLWIEYVNGKISTWKYKKNDLQQILTKHGISVNDENNKLLSVTRMKNTLYSTFNINMNVLNVEPPTAPRNSARTAMNIEEQLEEKDEHSETVINTAPTSNSRNIGSLSETQQIQSPQPNAEEYFINDLKKNKEKYKKMLRSEMMIKIKESQNIIQHIYKLFQSLQEKLDLSDFVEACHFAEIIDPILSNLNTLSTLQGRQQILYQAVPRRKSSRYVGRPEFILDLDKRIKQYTNEIGQIVKRLFELASQTRSPIFFGAASGPCYGLTGSSNGILWISPVMQLASMSHCLDIQKLWNGFLKNKYAPQRSELQQNYQYLALEEKVKALVNVAEQHKIDIILSKCKDLELGYLLSQIQEQGIEMEIEQNENNELDIQMEIEQNTNEDENEDEDQNMH